MKQKICVHASPRKNSAVVTLHQETLTSGEFSPVFPEDYPEVVGEVQSVIGNAFKQWSFIKTVELQVQGYFPSLLPLIAQLRKNYEGKILITINPTEIDPRWDETLHSIPGQATQMCVITALQKVIHEGTADEAYALAALLKNTQITNRYKRRAEEATLPPLTRTHDIFPDVWMCGAAGHMPWRKFPHIPY